MRSFMGMMLIALSLAWQAALADNAPIASAPQELLDSLDLSIAGYGKPAETKSYVVSVASSKWLIVDGRYGGDGDDPGRVVIVFALAEPGVKGVADKILQIPLEDTEIQILAGTVRITGHHVISFCEGCDSWKAAEAEDVFFIPLEIDLPGPVVKSRLTRSEASKMLASITAKANRDKNESPKDSDLWNYVDAEMRRAKNLLSGAVR